MFVLKKPALTLGQQKFVVHERLDGRLSLRLKGRDVDYRQVQEQRPAPKPRVLKIRRKPPKYDPPPTIPWRNMVFGNGRPL